MLHTYIVGCRRRDQVLLCRFIISINSCNVREQLPPGFHFQYCALILASPYYGILYFSHYIHLCNPRAQAPTHVYSAVTAGATNKNYLQYISIV